jgi:D-galacturonate reductase
LTIEIIISFRPGDDAIDAQAYIQALDTFKPGDACVIFTPDDTHFEMALEAIRRGIHVMITKPAVKTLAEHRQLYEEAKKKNVLVMIEGIRLIFFLIHCSFYLVHKRFDPMYSDARDRIRTDLGHFSYFYSFMSQPKFQLDTFRACNFISLSYPQIKFAS